MKPDTSDMIIVHDTFRRLLGDLPGLLRGVPEYDRARAAVLTGHLGDILTGLHTHHTEEDELLWPKLLERAPADAALILRMEEQHARVDGAVRLVREVASAYAGTAGRADAVRLAERVAELHAVLLEHLGEEEARILPLAAEHLTVPEWKALGEKGLGELPKDRLLVMVGWVLDSASPTGRAQFLRQLPLVARIAWLAIGRRAWKAEFSKVYGPAGAHAALKVSGQ